MYFSYLVCRSSIDSCVTDILSDPFMFYLTTARGYSARTRVVLSKRSSHTDVCFTSRTTPRGTCREFSRCIYFKASGRECAEHNDLAVLSEDENIK